MGGVGFGHTGRTCAARPSFYLMLGTNTALPRKQTVTSPRYRAVAVSCSATAVAVSGTNSVAITVASASLAMLLLLADAEMNQISRPRTIARSVQYPTPSKRLRNPMLLAETTFCRGRTRPESVSRPGPTSERGSGCFAVSGVSGISGSDPGMLILGSRTGLFGTPRDIQQPSRPPPPIPEGSSQFLAQPAAFRHQMVLKEFGPSGVVSTLHGPGSSPLFGL